MPTFVTTTDHKPFAGSHYQGEITATYSELVAAFGEPQPAAYKSDAEWRLIFIAYDPVVVSIYNWKNGKNYLGLEGLQVNEITDWNIGGFSPRAVEIVEDVLKERKTT